MRDPLLLDGQRAAEHLFTEPEKQPGGRMTRERTQASISGSQLDLRFVFQSLHLVFDTRGEVVFKVEILWQLKIEIICPLCV